MCAICRMMGLSQAQQDASHAASGGQGAPPVSDGREYEPLAAGTVAANGKTVYSLAQAVSALDRSGARWTPGSTVPFQFHDNAPAGLPGDITFGATTDIERQLVRTAFLTITDAINLKFQETPDDGSYGAASRKIGIELDSASPDYVWGYTSRWTAGFSGGFRSITSAEVNISPAAADQRKWFVGGYNFMAAMHEILHALGISHPGDYNADGTTITYANSAAYFQDSRQYTIMSYFDPGSTGGSFLPTGENASYSPSTLQLHDIAALQAEYGANTTARTGDTVYGYNSNADLGAYDIRVNPYPIYSIWDAGGNDTLDFSGSNVAARLDLRAGEFSDTMGMKSNISIAYGVTIENAVGTSAGDSITGNEVANSLRGMAGDDTLVGGGGNDTLDGGDGSDTAQYAGASTDYDWWMNADGSWTVDDGRTAAADGTDRLLSIETLKFADKSMALQAPTTASALANAYHELLRTDAAGADATLVSSLAADVSAGRSTLVQAYAQLAAKAIATTSVATLSYEFFTGMTPSKVGLDYLVSTTGGNANNLNSAYYQTFSTENRYINFAVNLGKLGEGAAGFNAQYGSLTLFDATRKAYAAIFGATPDDAKVHAILDPTFQLNGVTLSRADYFAYYGTDGPNGIGTKAAMVGFLLVEAAKADTGTYAKANDAFLLDLADGAHARVDLIGVYGAGHAPDGVGG